MKIIYMRLATWLADKIVKKLWDKYKKKRDSKDIDFDNPMYI